MRKSICYWLTGLTILFFFSECRKKPFDRRNKYTGDWQFHYTMRSTTMGNKELVTSGDYKGRIFYDGGKDKQHLVHLELAKDWEEEFELDADNYLIQCEKRGKFTSEKSLSIIGSSAGCHTHLGAEISYTISGSRQ